MKAVKPEGSMRRRTPIQGHERVGENGYSHEEMDWMRGLGKLPDAGDWSALVEFAGRFNGLFRSGNSDHQASPRALFEKAVRVRRMDRRRSGNGGGPNDSSNGCGNGHCRPARMRMHRRMACCRR
jgi:hypothetical protein